MRKIFFILCSIIVTVLLGFCVSAEVKVIGIEVESGSISCLENAYGEYLEKTDINTGKTEKYYHYDFIMPDEVIMRVNYSDGTYKLSSINKRVDGVMFKWFGRYQAQDPWLVGKDNYVIVEYLDFTTKLPVELIPNPIDHIETFTAPDREYIYGDEEYGYYDESNDGYIFWPTDLEGFFFTVYYKNGDKKVFGMADEDIYGRINGYRYQIYSTDGYVKAGIHTVKFYYMGHVAEYKVTLKHAYTPFPDVKAEAWYAEGVDYCASFGYIRGNEKGLFEPDKAMTREQLVVILARVMNADISSFNSVSFADVKENSWYSEAVEWARAKGITNGVGENLFGVGRSLSRQELATLLYRISKEEMPDNGAISSFTDSGNIAPFAREAMSWAVSEGILGSTSREEALLSPKMTVTRAQAAKIFMSFSI